MKYNKTKPHILSIVFMFIFLVLSVLSVFSVMYSIKDIRNKQIEEKAFSITTTMDVKGANTRTSFQQHYNNLNKIKIRLRTVMPDNETPKYNDVLGVLQNLYLESQHEYGFITSDYLVYNREGKLISESTGKQVVVEYDEIDLDREETIYTYHDPLTNEAKRMTFISKIAQPELLDIGAGMTVTHLYETVSVDDFDNIFSLEEYGSNVSVVFMCNMTNGRLLYHNGGLDENVHAYDSFIDYIKNNFSFNDKNGFNEFFQNIHNSNPICNTKVVKYLNKSYFFSYHHLDIQDLFTFALIPLNSGSFGSLSQSSFIIRDVILVFISFFLVFSFGVFVFWYSFNRKSKSAIQAEIKSNLAKTNFLSSMSHDIRTPMNAIIGYSDLGLRKGSSPSNMKASLERIKIASGHLLTLVNDVLDISAIESGKMVLTPNEFSLIDLMNSIISISLTQANKKGIGFHVHTHNFDQEYIVSDEIRISQLCNNLVSNAIKYTPSGGRVDFDFWQIKNIDPKKITLKCVVKDTGVGMSEEFQKIMYNSFIRATDTRVNNIAGTGLGLTIVKEIVDLFGGKIDCQSEVGKGSTFIFEFDVLRGKPDLKYELPPLHCFIYDEDNVSTKALERILHRLHLTYDVFNNIKDVSQVKSGYDIAFVCLEIPTHRGMAIVKKIRRKFNKEQLPIILTDTEDMTLFTKNIEKANIRFTLGKPYAYRTVYHAIYDVLHHNEVDIKEEHTKNIFDMNILIAEDNDMNYEILETILSMHGVHCDRARNGKESIELLTKMKSYDYDAILMDVRMPIMDGKTATKRIRLLKVNKYKNIPIIAMTADAFAEDIQSCLNAGMNNHMAKPIDTNKLITLLSDIKNQKNY